MSITMYKGLHEDTYITLLPSWYCLHNWQLQIANKMCQAIINRGLQYTVGQATSPSHGYCERKLHCLERYLVRAKTVSYEVPYDSHRTT